MCAEDCLPKFATFVRSENLRSHRLLCSYPEGVNDLLKKCATAQAFAENDTAILRHVQPSNMSFHKYADDLVPKCCKDADAYDVSILNEVFIEDVGTSIRYSLHRYWASNSRPELADISFHTRFLLSTRKGFGRLKRIFMKRNLGKAVHRKTVQYQNVVLNVNRKSGVITDPLHATTVNVYTG